MKHLKKAELIGANLFDVNTEEMVERYNQCLKHLGLPTTKLKSFSIDKLGWSPDISKEKDDEMYLTHGPSNTVGIILSVEQAKASLYFRHYSFDSFLIERVYHELKKPLMDITTMSGVCLDIENGISRFTTPFDLLMVGYYQVIPSTPNKIEEIARQQKKLVADFEKSEDMWQDPEVRKKLIESSEQHGDLRRRNILLHPIFFDEASSFFTRNYGGTFVFRDFGSEDKTLMIRVEKQDNQILESPYKDLLVMSIDEDNLVEKLEKFGILTLDLGFYSSNLNELERMKDDILADVVCNKNPENLEYSEIPSTQKKSYLIEYEKDIPEVYFEIEKLIQSLRMGKEVNELSKELRGLLLRPTKVNPGFKQAVNILLTFLFPEKVIQLYRFNKEKFYKQYFTWSKSKRKWVIWRIMNHYKGVNYEWNNWMDYYFYCNWYVHRSKRSKKRSF